jgi:hypothetical protein
MVQGTMHGIKTSKHTILYLITQVASIEKYFFAKGFSSHNQSLETSLTYHLSFPHYYSLKNTQPNLKGLGMLLLAHYSH